MCTCVYKYLLISWFLLGRKLLHTFQYTHIRQEIQKVTVLGFKVGQPWIAFCSWIINKSGVHNGIIEIHWLVYTFPWRQPESARRHVPLIWPAALCSGLAALSCAGRTLKKSSTSSAARHSIRQEIQKVTVLSFEFPRVFCMGITFGLPGEQHFDLIGQGWQLVNTCPEQKPLTLPEMEALGEHFLTTINSNSSASS